MVQVNNTSTEGTKKPNWRVCKNGVLPPAKTCGSFSEAVDYVSVETGESAPRVIEAFEAGCPTIRERDGAEFDIEEMP